MTADATDLVAPGNDQQLLRRTFGCFPSGVAVVSASLDDGPVGLVISSFSSVSLDPPLVSICVVRGSRRWSLLRAAPRLGLSFLGGEQQDLCRALAASGVDGFRGLNVTCTPEGAVLLPDATAWLDCTVHDEVQAGDHAIVLLRVQGLTARPSLSPLIFHSSRFHQLKIA